MRAAALGAQVIVTEIDPVKAMEAKMDGHDVMTIDVYKRQVLNEREKSKAVTDGSSFFFLFKCCCCKNRSKQNLSLIHI